MDELRGKREEKALKAAMIYYNMREYRAASTALLNVLNDFPESKSKEKILFHILKSQYLLADNSIKEKKADRLKTASQSYLEFINQFPQSEYLREAEKIYEATETELNKINQDEQIQQTTRSKS